MATGFGSGHSGNQGMVPGRARPRDPVQSIAEDMAAIRDHDVNPPVSYQQVFQLSVGQVKKVDLNVAMVNQLVIQSFLGWVNVWFGEFTGASVTSFDTPHLTVNPNDGPVALKVPPRNDYCITLQAAPTSPANVSLIAMSI